MRYFYLWVLRLSSVLVIGILVLVWLWVSSLPAQVPVKFGEELRHSNGLRTALPEGYKVEFQLPDGFRFALAGSRRYSNEIFVRGMMAKPAPKPSGSKVVARGKRYIIEELGGGSGGTEYQLTAWKEAAGGWIVVAAFEQTEFPRPGFDVGWAVLDRSTLEAP